MTQQRLGRSSPASPDDLDLARLYPLGLMRLATRGRYATPEHLLTVQDRLLDLSSRKFRRLAVFLPPRHGKSTLCSHYYPAWYLTAYPDHRVILTAHTSQFAAVWGRRVRDTVSEWGPAVSGVNVRYDLRSADEWDLESPSLGGMRAAGVGANILGRGADLLILDDPVQDAEEALSPTVREHHWQWYASTASTRLEPDAIELLVMHRWHPDDLGGRILTSWKESSLPYAVLTLPAIAEADDQLGRRVGEPLWPERYPLSALEERRRKSPLWWDALYQQRPTVEGGNIFKDKWFRRFTVHEDLDGQWDGFRLQTPAGVLLGNRADAVIFVVVDPALGKTAHSDEVAIGVFGLLPTCELLLLHLVAERMPVERIPPLLQEIESKWSPGFVGMEANGFQVLLARDVRAKLRCPVREIEPKGKGKLARAVTAIEMACAGRVYLPDLPECNSWVAKAVTQLCEWTGTDGDRDDIVDVLSYAALECQRFVPETDGDGPACFGERCGTAY